MFKQYHSIGLALAIGLQSAVVHATCAMPNSLSNGTPADASAVMGNFNAVTGCVNGLLTNASLTGTTYLSGSLGIGTASPPELLSLAAPSGVGAPGAPVFSITTVGSPTYGFDWTLETSATGDLALRRQEASTFTEMMHFQRGTGNVGINTNPLYAKLQIYAPGQTSIFASGNSSSDITSDVYIARSSSLSSVATGPNIRLDDGTSNDTNLIQNSQGSLTFWNFGAGAWNERLRIGSSGNVGIGTPTPSYTLHVNGSVAGTSAYNNLSDGRLKKNIEPISDPLALIDRLRGVRFDWRTREERSVGQSIDLPSSPQVGFVAQEVGTVLPEAISVSADDGLMSMQESKIVPILVEAVKQLQAEVESLRAKLQDTDRAGR